MAKSKRVSFSQVSQVIDTLNEDTQAVESLSHNDDSETVVNEPQNSPTFVSRDSAISKKKKTTKSKQAGVTFPVGRILRKLHKGNYASRIGAGAGVYMAAALEYLVAEIMDISGNVTHDKNRKLITSRFIQLAVRADDELDKLFKNVIISEGGVIPHIEPVLLKRQSVLKKEAKKRAAEKSGDNDNDSIEVPRPKKMKPAARTSTESNNTINLRSSIDTINANDEETL